jgi:hypothetical protein
MQFTGGAGVNSHEEWQAPVASGTRRAATLRPGAPIRPILPPDFAGRLSDWVQVIRREFLESPHLRVTVDEASRVWGLEAAKLEAVLDAFVAARFLNRSAEGVYTFHRNLEPSSPTQTLPPAA